MESRLFEPGTVPEHTTAKWYATRDRAPHLEDGLHRNRLLLAAAMIGTAVDRYGITTVSDMGCGDGGLLSLVPRSVLAWGYDLQPSNVQGAAERGMDVRLGDATISNVEWGELAICTEFLEHLVDPHGFVVAIPSRVVVASSPVFETAEQHYPFHTWAWDRAGYAAMFTAGGFEVVRHEVTGMFQVLMAVRRLGWKDHLVDSEDARAVYLDADGPR